jgi:large subunit ribosomal protein L21
MLYAIIESGDKQFRVEKGMRLNVPLMEIEPDTKVSFDKVLLCSNGTDVCVGTPTVENATVEATAIGETKDEKIRVFKMKRRKKYRRTRGHRQAYTLLQINALNLPIKDESTAALQDAHKKAVSDAADAANAADATDTEIPHVDSTESNEK